jgi:ketosteroid isomerase-like protein
MRWQMFVVVIRAGALAALVLCLPACAPTPPAHTDAEVATVLESFYSAIKRGDAQAAMNVIAPDAVFIESGRLETRAEYEKNHLPLDIDFERQITGKRSPLRITFAGDTAWIIATTEYDGKIEGGEVSFASSQLMVLTKDADAWKIRSIHWSSMPLLPQ